MAPQQTRKSSLLVCMALFVCASLAIVLYSPQQTFFTFHRGNNMSNLPQRVIWMFWDKTPVPPIIRLCLATLICHNQEDGVHVQLINQSQLPEWVHNVHPALEFLTTNHKGDYFRARILDSHGGMYVDADTIGLGSVKHLFDKLDSYDLVNMDFMPDGDPLGIQVLGPTRPKSRFTQPLVSGIHELLDNNLEDLKSHSYNRSVPYPIKWAEVMRDIAVPTIRKLLKTSDFRYFQFSGHKSFMQLPYTGNYYPFSNFSESNFTFRETEMLEFYQSGLGRSPREMTVNDLLHANFLFSSLVRYSMNECRENRSKLKRNKTITVDENTARNGDLIQWIESFMVENDL